MTIIKRSQWGAKPFPRAHKKVKHTHLEFHHDVYRRSLGWDGATHCRRIQDQHLSQGWNGPFYNLGLDKNGSLYELRGEGNQSQGTALTVVFFGDYENFDRLTVAQERTIHNLRTAWTAPVDWHRKRAMGTRYASACPGKYAIPVLRDSKAPAPVENPAPVLEDDVIRLGDTGHHVEQLQHLLNRFIYETADFIHPELKRRFGGRDGGGAKHDKGGSHLKIDGHYGGVSRDFASHAIGRLQIILGHPTYAKPDAITAQTEAWLVNVLRQIMEE